MSDQRKMMLLQLDTDDLVNWCMTLESMNAERTDQLKECREALRELVAYLDRGDLRGNQITDILIRARKLSEG